MKRTAATALALLAAACAGAPPARPPLELAPFTVLRAENFPGAKSVLAGFAAADDDPRMRVGDAALLGLELHRVDTIERLLLLLEVAEIPKQRDATGASVRPSTRVTITSTHKPTDGGEPTTEDRHHDVHPITVRLSRFDAAGSPLRTSQATLYEEPLAFGWWPYTQPASDAHGEDYAFALTMSLQELASRDPVLQDLLFRVVDEPSLWSVAAHLGVQVTLAWEASGRAHDAVPVDGFAGEVRPASLELRVNGSTASWVTMLVTKPNGASRACGGLVGAIAQHPNEPGRLAVVRLLATRRGAP